MKHPFKVLAVLILSVSIICSCSNEQKETPPDFKLMIEKYVGYWNTGQFDGIGELLCDSFELRMTPLFEPETGIETFKNHVTNWRTAYPDFLITIEEILISENAVAGRWTITASNTGAGSHPPTGKRVEVPGMSIFHFENGKIKDEWIASNNYYWLRQLGFRLVPPSFEEE